MVAGLSQHQWREASSPTCGCDAACWRGLSLRLVLPHSMGGCGNCTAFHSLVLGVTWKPSHQSPRPSPRTGWGGTSVSRAWRNACGWRAWVQPPRRMASHRSLRVRLGGLSGNQMRLCFQQRLRLSTGPSLPALGLLPPPPHSPLGPSP